MSPLRTIVVIEDQREVRENLMETLELDGYRVLGAADGHAGVALVRAESPQLILCDVMMPRLDGFGVLGLLRRDPATADIPFVFLTARAEREDLRRGMNLGAADYITKPFYQDELLRVVELRIAEVEGLAAKPDATPSDTAAPSSTPAHGIASAGEVQTWLGEIAATGRRHHYPDRAPICFYGDPVASVYRVEAGRVRLYRDTEFGKCLTLDTAGPGVWFGVGDLVSGANFNFAAAAHPEAEVTVVPAAEFRAGLARHPALAFSLARQLAQDLAVRSEQLLQVAYYSVRKRVAEQLLRELREGQTEVELRREDIAEAIASTPESVTRVLSEFRRDGIVAFPEPGCIRVLDLEGLAEVPA